MLDVMIGVNYDEDYKTCVSTMFITCAIIHISGESTFTNALEWSFGILANDVFIAALVGICSTLVDV